MVKKICVYTSVVQGVYVLELEEDDTQKIHALNNAHLDRIEKQLLTAAPADSAIPESTVVVADFSEEVLQALRHRLQEYLETEATTVDLGMEMTDAK